MFLGDCLETKEYVHSGTIFPKDLGNWKNRIREIIYETEKKNYFNKTLGKCVYVNKIKNISRIRLGRIVNLHPKIEYECCVEAEIFDPEQKNTRIVAELELKNRSNLGLFVNFDNINVFLSPQIEGNENIFDLKPKQKVVVEILAYRQQLSFVENINCIGKFIEVYTNEEEENDSVTTALESWTPF